jgi:hypothetical protein
LSATISADELARLESEHVGYLTPFVELTTGERFTNPYYTLTAYDPPPP